ELPIEYRREFGSTLGTTIKTKIGFRAWRCSLSATPQNFNHFNTRRFSVGTIAKEAGSLKLLDWNIERGLQMAGIGAAIESEKPDICILQEVDLNARRTGHRNVAEELARKFQLNYVFGVEFQELSQGSRDAPAYHGQALLSALPIRSSYVLRFVNQSDFWQPRWYLPNWQSLQRRLGGRMALVVEIEAGGATFVVYNAHLESRGDENLRLLQLEEILADAKDHWPEIPLILAGDFNTNSHASPVIKRLGQAGFRSALGTETVVTNLKGDSNDWMCVAPSSSRTERYTMRLSHRITIQFRYPSTP